MNSLTDRKIAFFIIELNKYVIQDAVRHKDERGNSGAGGGQKSIAKILQRNFLKTVAFL